MSSVNPAGPNQVNKSEAKEPVIKKPKKSPERMLRLPHPPSVPSPIEKGTKINPVKKIASVKQVSVKAHHQEKAQGEAVKTEKMIKEILKNSTVESGKSQDNAIVIAEIPIDPEEQKFLADLKVPGGMENLFTLSHYARHLYKQKKFEEADKYFKLALAHKDSQKDIYTLSRYALLLKDRGQFVEARAECKKAYLLPGGQEDIFVLSLYPEILRKLKEYERSLRGFRIALSFQESRRYPSILKGHVDTALEYVSQLKQEEKYDEAEAVLVKALEQPSRHHPALLREYGFILNWQGKFDEGRKQYAKAAELEKAAK